VNTNKCSAHTNEFFTKLGLKQEKRFSQCCIGSLIGQLKTNFENENLVMHGNNFPIK
jgi:hypothetical protein